MRLQTAQIAAKTAHADVKLAADAVKSANQRREQLAGDISQLRDRHEQFVGKQQAADRALSDRQAALGKHQTMIKGINLQIEANRQAVLHTRQQLDSNDVQINRVRNELVQVQSKQQNQPQSN